MARMSSPLATSCRRRCVTSLLAAWRRWRSCCSSRASTSPTCCSRRRRRAGARWRCARRSAPAGCGWPADADRERAARRLRRRRRPARRLVGHRAAAAARAGRRAGARASTASGSIRACWRSPSACRSRRALLFGLLPAWHLASQDVNESLKDGGRSAGGVRRRLRLALVVSEIALASLLLVARRAHAAQLPVAAAAPMPGFRPARAC